MTVISNDPSWWPSINLSIFYSYWTVAAGLVVVYDWVLTLIQEIDLIWTQRWSLMTVLYLVIRYVGIPYSVASILGIITFVSLTDAVSIPQSFHSYPMNTFICRGNIANYGVNGTNVVVTAMLGVIMIARLHAMYQRSRRMLIFLVIICLAVNIACGVITIIVLKYYFVSEELILSGIHICSEEFEGDTQLLFSMVWMLNTVWEVLALCLSVWIAAKHFRDLRRLGPWTGSTIGDCFRVLMESHVLYFASFAGVSCLQLVNLSPEVKNSNSVAVVILSGAMEILLSVQMFVLGPRLILSVRQYHAKLVAESDAETSMNSIVFQERVHVPTSSTV
ncbi:uncharacterized protein HD556DRAFT_1522466 [Suillus plorans]|uniref:DUF6533 domain-containing protein n=1 Tax=Suillus plorans TaxID=116603 RepID=A0A9P7E3P5_9AGAM|nr:uncharacterized protein HD556DRAFT_1522466 [Suillus plorans]KAG1810072.1 hypothetical protein HD556DRAFT_1522466 [Suillus plorans]